GRGPGPDRPDPGHPDRRIADLRRVALGGVGRAGGAAEWIARDRGREERAAGDLDEIRRPRRREDAEVVLSPALRRVRGAADDGDLVHDDVRAAEQRAVAVRCRREADDEDRDAEPGELAAVEAPQDEVV